MVEGTPLLRVQARKGLEGSNPFVSATHHFHTVVFRPIQRHMALFLFDYLHSLLISEFLRLHSFLFIGWYEMWYFEWVLWMT